MNPPSRGHGEAIGTVTIRERVVGSGQPCFVIAEIGINHNGSLELARQLVDIAAEAGCDAVKLQKRTVDVVYTREELARPRESPFGSTNGDLKRGLELDQQAYEAIAAHCRARGMMWFASCWDEASVDFIEQFDPPCYKIPSPCLTDDGLLRHCRNKGKPLILSTGMSTMAEIRHAVEVLGSDGLILMHCTSSYPAKPAELNLRAIPALQREFSCQVGYSGHEVGLQTTLAALVLGACAIERHITLDRAMWGSDQAASVEPPGLHRLVRDIRVIEVALGDGEKRVEDGELAVRAKLRRVGAERR